jgi:hypothetical protein
MSGDDMANDEELERLRHVLDRIGWDPQPGRSPRSYFIDFGEPHVPVSSALAAITEGDRFIFYVIFGVAAAEDRRDEVARFITRANYGLLIGDFELDYGDGQLQFRSSVDFSGVGLSEELIANVILPAMSAVEQYGDALMDVLAGRRGSEAAIEEAESV